MEDKFIILIIPDWFLWWLIFFSAMSLINIGLDVYKILLESKIKEEKTKCSKI